MIPFPTGKFKIIYADPPWQYRDKANAGARGASHKYPVMSLKDLLLLPVDELAASNSVCFLWVTPPFLAEGLAVLKAWGFTYKTIAFNWVKTNKDGSYYMGMGHYTRANAEIVLIGKRGKGLIRKSAGVNSVIAEPRRAHSQKPDAARKRIEALYGKVKRIELFARETAPGWASWGNGL